MKRTRLAAMALLFLLAGPVTAASRLVSPEPSWNAGIVARGEALRHVFVIRNEGTSDLHLTDVRPSCGCAAAEWDRVIAPGKEGAVTLVVQTKGFQGPISKSALVLSDDPGTPQATLMVQATVKALVEVLPSGFLRVQALAGEKASAEATVVSDDPTVSPAIVETPGPWASAVLAPVPQNELVPGRGPRQFRLRLTVAETAPEGLVGGAVKLSTGIAAAPRIDVPLSGFIRPTVAVSVGRVSFQNFVPDGEPVRRNVLLTNQNPKNERFAVTGAATSVDGIRAEVVPVDRQKIQVVMTVDPKIKKGSFEGTLTVKTNDPVRPEIRVPIAGTVLAREGEPRPKE